MMGLHCIKTWSSTQGITATSSGEAEYYGIVKAASIGLGIKSMTKDLSVSMDLEILTDASVAKSMASRRGFATIRHMDTHYLWVQERVQKGDILVSKVLGTNNPADLLTKFLDSATIENICLFLAWNTEKVGRILHRLLLTFLS